jgi:hypothetical protein
MGHMIGQQDVQTEPRRRESVEPGAEWWSEAQAKSTPASLAASAHLVIKPRQGLIVAGAVLIAVGVLVMIATLFQSELAGLLVLPLLGLMFLTWGIVAREAGPVIPGSILTGLGLGTIISQEWPTSLPSDMQGAVALIGLALGFLAIVPLTGLVARPHSHYWALIPGGFLLLVGISLLLGALGLVTFLSMYLWPAFIVVVGLVFIWRGLQPRRERTAA